jgi:uncharacterized delta-60 repeat protein
MSQASFSRSFARCFFLVCTFLSAATSALFAQTALAPDGFDPNVDGNVYALATQPDGKIIVGGQFGFFRPNGDDHGTARNNLARLNPDGTLDATFNPNANGPVRAILLQPDGKIVIGGDFTTLQPAGAATATTRTRLARLNADGSVDATFNFTITNFLTAGTTQLPIDGQVNALVRQSDGAIVVGGNFTKVQAGTSGTTLNRRNIFRVTSAGAVDSTYDPNADGIVLALALHQDGKIVVGGGFSTFQENGKTTATTRNRIARLNTDGTVDSQFDPNANNAVAALTVQRDGKIVLGGYFTTLQPVGNDAAANRSRLARLNVDGTLDSEFYPNAGGNVLTLALEPDGGLLIGGTFQSVWARGNRTVSNAYAARFAPDGTVDENFTPNVNAQVDAFTFQTDGKIVIGGHFTRSGAPGASTSIVRNRLARLNPNGSLDTGFDLDAGGRPLVSVVQSDGSIVIGGSFTNVAGATHTYLARLKPDGTIDPTYNPTLDGRVLAMAYDAATNKVLIGGAFTTISTAATGTDTRNHIARLNPDGSPDSEFNPNINGQVATIVLQSDGQILVGGSFGTVQPIGAATFTTRFNLVRLTSSGQIDATFDPAPDNTVASIAVQSDGKIFIGGDFTSLSPNSTSTPTPRSYVARLKADGSIDTAWSTHFNARVTSLALQGDGKLVAAGAFTQVALSTDATSTSRFRLARLDSDGAIDTTFDPTANSAVLALAVQTDGKILIGGAFTTLAPNATANWVLRKYFARLNADGTVDPTFDLDLNEQSGNRVDSIRLQSDGRILVGGTFTSVQPLGSGVRTARKNFARINANGTLDTGFDVTASGSGGAINALALQANGKVVAVGSFSDLGGAKTTNIARFNPEGGADLTFGSVLATDGPLNAVAIRPNGAPVPTQLPGLAWFNSDGSLRSGFTPLDANGSALSLSGEIHVVAFQSDGKILLGGSFTNLKNTTHNNLLRFNPSGVIDSTFTPDVDGVVEGIVLQSDGQIIIVGNFSTVNGTTRLHIARLASSGSLDASYDPNANSTVVAAVLQSDGKLVIGGLFTTLTPNSATTSTTRTYIARLNPDGTADTFNPTPNSMVRALALQSDGKIVAGGDFTTVLPNGATATTARNFIARFNTDGTFDTGFDPNLNGSVTSLLVQPNGSVVLGGSFTTLTPNISGTSPTEVTRNNLARVGSNGAVDTTFNPNPNGSVLKLALQTDGSILVGGNFTTLQPNGATVAVTRNHLARLTASGTIDFDFNPDLNGSVTGLLARSDGSVLVGGSFDGVQRNGVIIVGGAFTTIGSTARKNLAIVNDDGSVNSAFNPNPNGAINALLTYGDGRFIAGGAFTSVTPAGSTTAITRNRLARFNADASLDTAFNPDFDGAVTAVALQVDGKLLVAGAFTKVNGVARATLARINADGTLDTTFVPAAAGAAGLAVQPDGRILVASGGSTGTGAFFGSFYTVNRLNADGSLDASFSPAMGGEVGGIRALALQADGKIIVAGSFPALSNVGTIGNPPLPASPAGLARLNANGTIDTSFNPSVNNAVNSLALQFDGRLVIGGSFTKVGGQNRYGLTRLASTGSSTQAIGVTSDRSTAIWTRSGATGELAGATFEVSSDGGRTWSTPVAGTRVGTTSNWQASGLNLPASGLFYVRARGIAPSSAGVASGLYELVREFNYTSPVTISSDGAQTDASGFAIDPTTGVIANLPPSAAGVYLGAKGTAPEIVGVASTTKTLGAATELRANIQHPNTNIYDQVLLQGAAATITADAGQITRLSFVDLSKDIVQVEFSGAGSLSLVLDAPSGPSIAENYNQPGVSYMQGHAGIVITGANETTNVSVFSVGKLTAVDQSLFRSDVAYDGVADLAYLAISSTDGKFGSVRTGNASYFATHGITGLYAPGVQFTGPVNLGDISGYDAATAMLVVGSASDLNITGGDLWQANRQAVEVSGINQLKFIDGMTSNGTLLQAQSNRAQLKEGDVDVTGKIVVNPAQ